MSLTSTSMFTRRYDASLLLPGLAGYNRLRQLLQPLRLRRRPMPPSLSMLLKGLTYQLSTLGHMTRILMRLVPSSVLERLFS